MPRFCFAISGNSGNHHHQGHDGLARGQRARESEGERERRTHKRWHTDEATLSLAVPLTVPWVARRRRLLMDVVMTVCLSPLSLYKSVQLLPNGALTLTLTAEKGERERERAM